MEYGWCQYCGKKFIRKATGRGRKWCGEKCRHRSEYHRNKWKRQDVCPSCGGMKMKIAKRCVHCNGTNNPTGINGR